MEIEIVWFNLKQQKALSQGESFFCFHVFSLYFFTTLVMQESHSGSDVSQGISERQRRQNNSPGFIIMPSPSSKNSISLPSVKQYFSLSDRGMTILPSLSTFLITPPQKQKVRLPEQTHKNANPNSRQTNLRKAVFHTRKLELAFCQMQFPDMSKKDILFPKRKLYRFALFD